MLPGRTIRGQAQKIEMVHVRSQKSGLTWQCMLSEDYASPKSPTPFASSVQRWDSKSNSTSFLVSSASAAT